MRSRVSAAGIIGGLTLASQVGADIPLETSPSYVSTALGHVATGGAWADIDGDGWLDMVVANGNDIERQSVVIYRNNGDGTLPLAPSWSSADVDYHGHLDIGDVNDDGRVDVAVAVYLGPAGFEQPGNVKLYLNQGDGTLTSTPAWTSADSFYSFSVALGDVDGDGDLDLAAASGESYFGDPDHHRVYMNEGGVLEPSPSWIASDLGYALDVFWDDLERDGDLDLVFCAIAGPMRVYRNDQTAGGGLMTTPIWESTDTPRDGNTAAFGDWNDDGYPELAVADNNQIAGPGRFKVYDNTAGTLAVTPTWTSATGGYGSHVSWVDLDLDGDADLGTGRWFGQARIYENTGGDLTTSPVWISSTSSVIENMFWGDVDNDGLHDDGLTVATGTSSRTFFRLGQQPVRSVDEVRVDGVPVAPSEFVAHTAYGWISMATPPAMGAQVEIVYTYSTDLDLGVTNWDTARGNYVFTNTATIGVPDVAEALSHLSARPNPVRESTLIRYRGAGAPVARVTVHDVNGRRLKTLHEGPIAGGLVHWDWDRSTGGGERVANGVYFVRVQVGAVSEMIRLVVL